MPIISVVWTELTASGPLQSLSSALPDHLFSGWQKAPTQSHDKISKAQGGYLIACHVWDWSKEQGNPPLKCRNDIKCRKYIIHTILIVWRLFYKLFCNFSNFLSDSIPFDENYVHSGHVLIRRSLRVLCVVTHLLGQWFSTLQMLQTFSTAPRVMVIPQA